MHTLSEFSDNAKLVVRFEGVQHLNDIFMLQISKNFDLLPQIADVPGTLTMLHDEFHCGCLSGRPTSALVYLRMVYKLSGLA